MAFKEIVTKAVIGKGKKTFKDSYVVTPEIEPSTVLGCWVINHKFKGYKTKDGIGVDGSYDVNIWYSYENDSKTTVVNKKIDYSDTFDVKIKEDVDLISDTDIIVKTLKQPTCTQVKVEDGNIKFDIDKELGVEIVGETKVKIAIEEDEEPWQDLNNEDYEKIVNDIDKNINENYLN